MSPRVESRRYNRELAGSGGPFPERLSEEIVMAHCVRGTGGSRHQSGPGLGSCTGTVFTMKRLWKVGSLIENWVHTFLEIYGKWVFSWKFGEITGKLLGISGKLWKCRKLRDFIFIYLFIYLFINWLGQISVLTM